MKNSNGQSTVKHSNRWIYLLLSIIIMICLGTVYSWSVFRIKVEEYYQIGSTLSGFPYMVSLAMYALFVFLTGKYLDKYKPQLLISVGALLVSVGWILSSLAPNIVILTLTYGVITGSGVGIAYGVPMSVIARLYPEKKGLAVGIVLSGFGISPSFTGPVARYLMVNYGIHRTFLMFGLVFGFILLLLAQVFRSLSDLAVSTSPAAKIAVVDRNTKEMVKTGEFRGLYFNFIIGTMIGLMLVGVTSSIGVQLIHIPTGKVTLLLSLFAVFNGLGRPIFGWITDKFSPKTAMVLSYLLIFTASSLMLTAGNGRIITYGIAFCIFWFNLGGWLAIAPTSTLALFGTKYYSMNFGVVFTAYGIGAIIGVVSSGILIDQFSYRTLFYFIHVLCIIGLVSFCKVFAYSRTCNIK